MLETVVIETVKPVGARVLGWFTETVAGKVVTHVLAAGAGAGAVVAGQKIYRSWKNKADNIENEKSAEEKLDEEMEKDEESKEEKKEESKEEKKEEGIEKELKKIADMINNLSKKQAETKDQLSQQLDNRGKQIDDLLTRVTRQEETIKKLVAESAKAAKQDNKK